MRSEDLRRSIARVRIAGAVLIAAFVVLAGRAAHLSVIDTRGAKRGIDQRHTVLRLAPARGLIADRSGAELAVTVSAPSVYAVPRDLEDRGAAASALARALGMREASVLRRLESSSRFVFVARWVDGDEAHAVEALGLNGIGVVQEPRRVYPHHELGAHLLGFANIDGEGARGLEQLEDEWLRGRPQKIAVERDNHGRLLAPAGTDPRSAAGGDVALTLDVAFQAEAETALQEVVEATGARGGIVVALDPDTGDLLAVAERPGFDPNQFRTTPYAITRSRAFLDALEPGSALKPFVVALGLERGVLGPEEAIDCEEGSFRIPGKTLRDTKPHGWLDPGGVLRVSSNIGAAKIGFRVGAKVHYEGLRTFGFGRATGSRFPDESSGLLRNWKQWRQLDHATISFGQGISVTPVQLAAAAATFANGGVLRRPRLLAARRAPDGAWQTEPVDPGRTALSRPVSEQVRGMMESVVAGPDGTGSYAALHGVSVAGKTGTAQKLDPNTGTYSTERYLAWFVGIAPADDPSLVVVVMIDEPQGLLHSGGATAAPLFARVAAGQLVRQGIVTKPQRSLHELARVNRPRPVATQRPPRPEPARTGTVRTAPPKRRKVEASRPPRAPELAQLGDRVLLPDFRGLSDAELIAIRGRYPFPIELRGAGRAVAQDPAPGTVVAAGSTRVSIRLASRGEGG